MAYTPTNWVTGDVVTAEKLNKIENGISSSGGAFYVTFNGDYPSGNEGDFTNVVADHTLEEAMAAYNAGQPVIFRMGGETNGETWTWGDALAYDDGGFLKATVFNIYNVGGETPMIQIDATLYFLEENDPSMQLLSRKIVTL